MTKKGQLLEHLGKPLKAKPQPYLFSLMSQRGRKTGAGSKDHLWIGLIFLFVLALGGFVLFSSVKRVEEKYRNSQYYVELNNLMYHIQDETLRDIGM